MAQQPYRNILVISYTDSPPRFINELTCDNKYSFDYSPNLQWLKFFESEPCNLRGIMYKFTGLSGFDEINYTSIVETEMETLNICKELRALQCHDATMILFVVRKHDDPRPMFNNTYRIIREAYGNDVPTLLIVTDCESKIDAERWKSDNRELLHSLPTHLEVVCGSQQTGRLQMLVEEICDVIEKFSLNIERITTHENYINDKSRQHSLMSEASSRYDNKASDNNKVPSATGKF